MELLWSGSIVYVRQERNYGKVFLKLNHYIAMCFNRTLRHLHKCPAIVMERNDVDVSETVAIIWLRCRRFRKMALKLLLNCSRKPVPMIVTTLRVSHPFRLIGTFNSILSLSMSCRSTSSDYDRQLVLGSPEFVEFHGRIARFQVE